MLYSTSSTYLPTPDNETLNSIKDSRTGLENELEWLDAFVMLHVYKLSDFQENHAREYVKLRKGWKDLLFSRAPCELPARGEI